FLVETLAGVGAGGGGGQLGLRGLGGLHGSPRRPGGRRDAGITQLGREDGGHHAFLNLRSRTLFRRARCLAGGGPRGGLRRGRLRDLGDLLGGLRNRFPDGLLRGLRRRFLHRFGRGFFGRFLRGLGGGFRHCLLCHFLRHFFHGYFHGLPRRFFR